MRSLRYAGTKKVLHPWPLKKVKSVRLKTRRKMKGLKRNTEKKNGANRLVTIHFRLRMYGGSCHRGFV
jgi:hypothetical protein